MSDSTKRKRDVPFNSWVTQAEDATVKRLCTELSVSRAELIRILLFGYKPPPHQIDRELMGEALRLLANLTGNFNQLTKYANLGRVMEASIDACMREILEWRGLLMRAMGEERRRKPPKSNQ